MSPRSSRMETPLIAMTGLRFRPTTNRLVTLSISSAGGPSDRLRWTVASSVSARTVGFAIGSTCLGGGVRVAVMRVPPECGMSRRRCRRTPERRRAAGPIDALTSAWARGSGCSRVAEEHQKSRGPDWPTAVVSARVADLPPPGYQTMGTVLPHWAAVNGAVMRVLKRDAIWRAASVRWTGCAQARRAGRYDERRSRVNEESGKRRKRNRPGQGPGLSRTGRGRRYRDRRERAHGARSGQRRLGTAIVTFCDEPAVGRCDARWRRCGR